MEAIGGRQAGKSVGLLFEASCAKVLARSFYDAARRHRQKVDAQPQTLPDKDSGIKERGVDIDGT